MNKKEKIKFKAMSGLIVAGLFIYLGLILLNLTMLSVALIVFVISVIYSKKNKVQWGF